MSRAEVGERHLGNGNSEDAHEQLYEIRSKDRARYHQPRLLHSNGIGEGVQQTIQ